MILADTHVWFWWMGSPEFLSRKARAALEEAEEVFVSAISCWELGMLAARRRIKLDRDVLVWIKQSLARPELTLVALTPDIAVAASRLDGELHGDPADRIIAATAMELGATLVTKDQRLRSFDRIETIW